MPQTVKAPEEHLEIGDVLTATQFAQIFPLSSVTEVLDSFGCGTTRVRGATREKLVYFQMMLSLFRNKSIQAVYRTTSTAIDRIEGRETLQSLTSSALTQGLDNLKPEVFETLFHRFAAPAGKKGHPGIWFKNRQKISIDGFTLSAENSAANRKYFGGPSNQHGEASLPQLRSVCFMETGSRLPFRAAIGPYLTGEATLANELVSCVEPHWIILADRNFYSFNFCREITNRGAAFLFRVQRGMALSPEKQLSDGSYLLTVYSSDDTKKTDGMQVRLVQYKITGTKKPETVYLLTNILDPKQATAEELGWLYGERWEHESMLDEMKTHLNLSSVTMRSKSPKRVLQDAWGLYMTYFSVRYLMYTAACLAKTDPDRLSFTHVRDVIQDRIAMERNAKCENCGHLNETSSKSILREALEQKVPERTSRTVERTVRKHKKYQPMKGKKRVSKNVNYGIQVTKRWSYGKPRR